MYAEAKREDRGSCLVRTRRKIKPVSPARPCRRRDLRISAFLQPRKVEYASKGLCSEFTSPKNSLSEATARRLRSLPDRRLASISRNFLPDRWPWSRRPATMFINELPRLQNRNDCHDTRRPLRRTGHHRCVRHLPGILVRSFRKPAALCRLHTEAHEVYR